MPPLAYSRFSKTVKRKLVEPPKKIASATRMPFRLADLRPLRRDGSSYTKKLSINQKRNFRANWPAVMIQQSTQIFGQIPAVNYFRRSRFDMPRPGYFFEKSEVEVSPVDNIFREKRYSLRAFFEDLSRNDFSRRSSTRYRRETNEEHEKDEEVEDFDQAAYVSRLLTILARDHRATDKNLEDSVQGKDNLGHRSKRQVGEEKVEEGIEEQEEGERAKIDVDDSKRQTNGREGSRYTPVYKDCNDTAASEISDLNAPPPPPERRLSLQEYKRNSALLRDIDFVPKKNPPIINKRKNEDSQILASVPPAIDEEEVAETPKETASTLNNIQNGTYINLQDHQKGAQDGNVPKDANGYPLDIPPYNPDVIPYVDVPDYSDQREESLDKDDRRVAKEKYVEYPDDDADVIDPGVPLLSDKRSEKIIVRDDDVVENDEVVEGPNNSQSQGAEEVKGEDLEEEEVERENSRVSSDNEKIEEEKENEETNSKDVRNSESDDVKDFEPIHFDINEYKKPFNLEELFKEVERESYQAQVKNKTKVGDVNEHQSSRNIPVRGDSHDVISGASGKYHNDEDFKLLTFKSPGKKVNDENQDYDDKKNAPQDATIASPNFFEEFEKVFGPPVSQTPFTGYFDTAEDEKEGSPSSSAGLVENDNEKYPYGDVNTYDRLFGAEAEEDKAQDDDTYHKQNSDDYVAVFEGEKKSQKTSDTKEPTDESLREAYKTLATILDRKDDISRLDDEVAKKAKVEGKTPAKYNNHWTLEYGTPIEEEKT